VPKARSSSFPARSPRGAEADGILEGSAGPRSFLWLQYSGEVQGMPPLCVPQCRRPRRSLLARASARRSCGGEKPLPDRSLELKATSPSHGRARSLGHVGRCRASWHPGRGSVRRIASHSGKPQAAARARLRRAGERRAAVACESSTSRVRPDPRPLPASPGPTNVASRCRRLAPRVSYVHALPVKRRCNEKAGLVRNSLPPPGGEAVAAGWGPSGSSRQGSSHRASARTAVSDQRARSL
jgi:hypothetical protein